VTSETGEDVRARAAGPAASLTGAHKRAQRRARVILSDLYLYDKEALVRAAHADDSKKELGSLWKDAIHSYNDTVPSDVRNTTNYLEDELKRCLSRLHQG
jgi:hypothetical protein